METQVAHNAGNLCKVCQKPALHKCGGCHKVHYCSRPHQKDDWKDHKESCRPFKISEDAILGRHLVATRPLKYGEVVLQEAPVIWGPFQNTVPICLGCGKCINQSNSRPCTQCGWPVCGDLCEKAPAHIPECRYTIQKGEKVSVKNFEIVHPIYQCITVLRCLYQKQFLPKVWKKLDLLESHCSKRKSTTTYERERVTIAQFLLRFFKLSSAFSEEEIMRVSGIVAVNSHEVPLTDPPHLAIYGTSSMLEHNCTANCTKSFTTKGQIIITAATGIAPGDHLSICYTDPLWSTPNRRYFLNETKFFWCECSRCQDPTEFGTNFSALKCLKPDCKGVVLPSSFIHTRQKLPDWICNDCSSKISSYSANDILERVGKDLYELDKTNVPACQKFLEIYSSYLNPNHCYLTDLNYTLSQILGQETGLADLTQEDLVLKLKLCQKLENLIKVLAPAEKRTLGLVLFEMHAATAEIVRRKGTICSAEEIQYDLMQSRKILEEAARNLEHEPEVLPEGKVYKQALQNLKDIDMVLRAIYAKIGNSP